VKKVSDWLHTALTEEGKGTPIQHNIDILQNLHKHNVHPKFKRLKYTKEFTEKVLKDALEAFGIEK
jgi:hypothetical protein